MKSALLAKLGMLSSVPLLVVACGGSTTPDGSGGLAGSSSTAGTSSAGSSSAGSGSSGAPSGGASNGGASSGGTAAATYCMASTDCVDCAYPTAPQTSADCYCAVCAITPLSKTACTSNQAAWQAVCSGTPRACPAIACVPPAAPVCTNNVCTAGASTLPGY